MSAFGTSGVIDMARNDSNWVVVIAWIMLLSGCTMPSPARKRTISQSRQTTDRKPIRPGAPSVDATALSPTVSLAGYVAATDPETAEDSTLQKIQNEISGTKHGTAAPQENPSQQEQTAALEAETAEVPINLPTALAMIGGQHPIVGFARWRVQEAYAQLDRAKAIWLPSIQSGFNYRRRDGNYQDVQGSIVDVNLNSFNVGLGAGAVGAGAPNQAGIIARYHLADALFLPKEAEKTAWAREYAASATLNQQLLVGSVAYTDLLEAHQDHEIIAEAVQRTRNLCKITKDYAETGQGLQSDADRTATELALLQTRQLAARERQLVASTRLARALSIPMSSTLLPQDTTVVPLELLLESKDESSLIVTGLTVRPELSESQALVAAACEAYRREKYAPFVPSVLLGFSTTSFGGGLGSKADNFGGRYDLDALMVWETRNLGYGEASARRQRNAQIQQAKFAKLRMMDQVAQEVAEANVQVIIRRQQMKLAQDAITSARASFQRNIDRIREGQGLPIEVLQSIQALEASERSYLTSVINYNRAQLQLQWALGWPINVSASDDPLADQS
jgi:outer membrane protein TolC